MPNYPYNILWERQESVRIDFGSGNFSMDLLVPTRDRDTALHHLRRLVEGANIAEGSHVAITTQPDTLTVTAELTIMNVYGMDRLVVACAPTLKEALRRLMDELDADSSLDIDATAQPIPMG